MADILIKGMEMPKSCGDCELAKHFDGYNENDCPFNAFSFYDCPLVPVPSHGRLVDADLLYDKWIWGSTDRTAETKCIELIDLSLAPTVIEASDSNALNALDAMEVGL